MIKTIKITTKEKKELQGLTDTMDIAKEGFAESCRMLKDAKRRLWDTIMTLYPEVKDGTPTLSTDKEEWKIIYFSKDQQ